VSGTVADRVSGALIGGANVVVVGTGLGAATYEDGRFTLGPIRAGAYRLVVSHVGFSSETLAVEVPAGGVARVSFRLVPEVIAMPGVEVESPRARRERTVTVREISNEQLARNAGGFVADPVRTLSFLPGVGHSSRGEWSGAYAVRGGEPDESSVFFGTTELLWPYHLLGFSSVINSDLVERMAFYPSAFPVRFGGALSSVVVVHPRRVRQSKGFWAYDPMNAKAAYVAELGDIRFLGSYRRSYYYVLFGPMGGGSYNRPSFSDFTGQAELSLGSQSRLRTTVVSGADHVVSDLQGETREMAESGTSFSLELESELGRTSTSVQVFSNAHDFGMTPAAWSGTAQNAQRETGVRLMVAGRPAHRVELTGGAELSRVGFAGSLLSSDVLSRADHGAAAFVGMSLAPVARVGLDLGLRCEDVRWARDRVLEPQALLSLHAGPGMTFRSGYRRVHQHAYSFLRNSCASFVFDRRYDEFRLFESGALGAKRADHYSVGGELALLTTGRVTVEVYRKDYSGLPTWQTTNQGELHEVGNRGLGRTQGLELTLERFRLADLTGWLTYGLAWCRKQQGDDTTLYWDRNDRRHSLNLMLEQKFAHELVLTATFHLHTGAPYTPLLYTRSPQEVQGSDLNRGRSRYVIEGEKNSARVPAYHRLDLKLSKELPRLPLSPYLYIELLNVYNRQNAYYLVQFEDRNGRIVTGRSDGIPLMPLIGIGGRF
jgi:hypothetical protein